MTLKQQAGDWIRSVAHAHVGKNIRRFTWTTWTGETHHNSLGGVSYLTPKEGKVVDANDTFTLVKVALSEFCVVATHLLDQSVSIGDKIALSFYQLRRFDGSLADGSGDPSNGWGRTIMLTGAKTQFPVKWEDRHLGINERFAEQYTPIGNPYLRDLIEQMERLTIDGGLRCVANVLIDAGATDLSFNDPHEEDSSISPPAIRCHVNTGKHRGGVEIGYDRASDTYFVETKADDATVDRRENVHFNELGETLIDLIDDRSWIKANVTLLKPAPKKRTAATAEAA